MSSSNSTNHLSAHSTQASKRLSLPTRVSTMTPTVVLIPNHGLVQGIYDDEKHVRKFLNIPFATVHKRWQRASPVAPWTGIRDATHYGYASNSDPAIKATWKSTIDLPSLMVIHIPPFFSLQSQQTAVPTDHRHSFSAKPNFHRHIWAAHAHRTRGGVFRARLP